MQATITIDNEMLAAAREYVGLQDTSAVVDVALRALIEREASLRLAALGGTEPNLVAPPRRRFPPDE